MNFCSNNNKVVGYGTIKIWKSNPPYSDNPIKELKGHRDIMISGSYGRLPMWNILYIR